MAMRSPSPDLVGSRPVAVVVSDVLLYREGIAAGLARIGRFERVEAAAAEALPALLAALRPDIMFVDVSRRASCESARLGRDIVPGLVVIGFGMSSDEQGLAGAEAGMTAFVPHDGRIEDLDAAARAALDGKPVCPARLMSRLLERVEQVARAPRPRGGGALLTRRERQVASLVENGLSNKEIAGTLNISPATVKNHVHIILDKLNLPRRRLIVTGRDGAAPERRPLSQV